MADFQNAGYRLLTFKYTPPSTEDKQAAEEEKQICHVSTTGGEDGDLPSLSSLLTSIQEIQGSLNDTGVNDRPGEELELLEKGKGKAASTSTTEPLTEFPRFNDFPTEIRLKIWDLTFLPRVVELRQPRPAWIFEGQWQSGCSNPAQLAVSTEAREVALAHYRIPFPLLTTIAKDDQRGNNAIQPHDDMIKPIPYQPQPIKFGGWSSTRPDDDGGREMRRKLYISPEYDTLCLLGQDWDPVSISSVLKTLREADPLGLGIRRLGTSVRAWSSFEGSAAIMKRIGSTLFQDLDQFSLFMYGVKDPPRKWWAKGWAMVDGEEREQYRREGNRCVLEPCEPESGVWEAYKIWFAGNGRGFWNGGDVLRYGRKNNEIQFMKLKFEAGW